MEIRHKGDRVVCLICGSNSYKRLIDMNFFKKICDGLHKDENVPLIIERHRYLRYVYCLGCGLIYQQSPPSDDCLSEFYRTYRSEMDLQEFREYTDMKIPVNSKRIDWMEKSAPLGSIRGRMLDVGTADGSMCELFKRRGWDVSGVEHTGELVKFSKMFYRDINIIENSYKKELFPERYFDLIIFSHCLEHFRDPSEAIEICSYHLKDRGYLFIEAPTFLSKNFTEFVSTHLFIFTENSLFRLLEKQGYRIVRSGAFFYKDIAGRIIRVLCQNGRGGKKPFVIRKTDFKKEYALFKILIIYRYIYIFILAPFIVPIKKIIKRFLPRSADINARDKTVVIIESLNIAALFYISIMSLFRKIDIFCLKYAGAGYDRIYNYFNMRVIDVESIDLTGINVPFYFISGFPDLKRRISENSFILTEKYSHQLFMEGSSLIRRSSYFLGEYDVSVALKRYILFDLKEKIKCYEFASIILRCEDIKSAIYIPADMQLDFLRNDELYSSLSLRIPAIMDFVISLKSFFKYRFICFCGSILLILNILRRGLTIKRDPVKKNMAMPLVWGIKDDGGLSEKMFIDNDKLSPADLLFTIERWEVNGKTTRFFSNHNVDTVKPDKVKASFSYLLNRLIYQYFFIFFLPAFISSIFKKRQFLFLNLIRTCKNVIDYEIFLDRYDIKVYIARDENSVNSNIRTVVFNKRGVKSLGLPHGDYNHPFIQPVGTFSYIELDEYFIWGREYERYFRVTNQGILKYTPVGIPSTNIIKNSNNKQNEFLNLLRDKKIKYKIMSVFTGYISERFLEDKPHRLMENIKYFNYVIRIYQEYKETYNIYLVFKYKDRCPYDEIASDLKDLLKPHLAEGSDIALFNIDISTYDLMAHSDMIIAWGSTSTGMEAISIHKPVVYYDPYKSEHNILRSLFGSKIVAWDEKELKEAVGEIMSGGVHPDDRMYECIRREFCNVDADLEPADSIDLIKRSIHDYL